MVLKKIITRNLQSHKEVVIDLPPTGLVVFTGDNSNGKSVIGKTLEALLTNKIAKPRKRNSLINRTSSFGSITFIRSDDVILEAHIQREAAGTYIKFSKPGEDDVKRYIADRSYKELLYQFGWHYSDETGISLNIAQEEDALLFYKTPARQIRTLVDSATNDIEADIAAESFAGFLKETRGLKDGYNSQQNAYMSTLNNLVIEDVNPIIELNNKLKRCHRNLSAVYFPTIPEIKAVPKVHYVEPYVPHIPIVKYPRIVSAVCNIPDITKIAGELKVLKEHRCPTCGRGFDADDCESPVHN